MAANSEGKASQKQLRRQEELVEKLKKENAPAEKVGVSVGVAVDDKWVGRVDDEALGLVPDCSVIQAEMAVLLLRRSWRALCQRRVNIRVVLH